MRIRLTAALSATLALSTPGTAFAQITEDGRQINRISQNDLEDQLTYVGNVDETRVRTVYRTYENGDCALYYFGNALIGYDCSLTSGHYWGGYNPYLPE